MCLIAFAIGVSERLPLVIAANRDEFLNRPTQPLARWHTPGGQEIISGRDLIAGGTWLGMTPGGRVAFLTNVREPEPRAAPWSRGMLLTRWFESRSNVEEFSGLLEHDAHQYGAFNLVVGDLQEGAWMWLTNRSKEARGCEARLLAPGIYGLSNAALDTPWPKTVALKKALEAALLDPDSTHSPSDAWQTTLWAALASRARASLSGLPSTGISQPREVALSSAFVEMPEHGYGTRSSTVLKAQQTIGAPLNTTLRIDIKEKTHQHPLTDAVPVTTTLTFDLEF